eukprot:645401-Amphidinium_carterae.2
MPLSYERGAKLLQAALEEFGVKCDAQEEEGDKADEEKSALDCLEAELSALQASSDAKQPNRVRIHAEVTRGLTVLACPQGEGIPPPSKLVEAVFAQQRKEVGEKPDIRFVVRMVPLDIVMAPHPRNFRDALEKHLPQLLADVPKDSGWSCSFHSRAMNTLTYKDVLAVLKELVVAYELELSVSEPDVMFVVETRVIATWRLDWRKSRIGFGETCLSLGIGLCGPQSQIPRNRRESRRLESAANVGCRQPMKTARILNH